MFVAVAATTLATAATAMVSAICYTISMAIAVTATAATKQHYNTCNNNSSSNNNNSNSNSNSSSSKNNTINKSSIIAFLQTRRTHISHNSSKTMLTLSYHCRCFCSCCCCCCCWRLGGERSLDLPQSGNALQEVYVCVGARENVRRSGFSVVGVFLKIIFFFFLFFFFVFFELRCAWAVLGLCLRLCLGCAWRVF